MLSINERTGLTTRLMDEGGAIIRYLTRTEILGESPTPQETEALLAHPLAQMWLARLKPGAYHGSKPTELENVFAKLAHMGLRAGMPPIDAEQDWIIDGVPDSINVDGDPFNQAWLVLKGEIFSTFLLATGLDTGERVHAFVDAYLKRLHIIPRDKLFDFYMTGAEKETMNVPQAYRDKPIIRPEVIRSTIRPTIYSLMLMAVLPAAWQHDYTPILNDVLDWILDPRMQSLPDGYGYGYWREGGVPHSHGWSPHLPGYFSPDDARPLDDSRYLLRVLLMARFPRARQSDWFQRSTAHLLSLRTDDGLFEFPAKYLKEMPGGYYVNASYMGLGENRRSRQGRRLEATYYALWLDGKGSDRTGG